MTDYGDKFIQFVGVVESLRSENGCPWDREQTPQSLVRYLEEETLELIDAIASKDAQHIKEELGDILYLVVLVARIHSEKDLFTIGDVIDTIKNKMVRRHPHVFNGENAGTRDELRKKWLRIKDEEKADRIHPKKN